MSAIVARRYYVRARAALTRGDRDTAREALHAAMSLAPDFASARISYAQIVAMDGDCPRAAQLLRSGLAQAARPRAQAAMWAALGDVLTRGGDFLGAEEAFDRAAATHKALAGPAAAGLARVCGKTGRLREAVAHLRAAVATRTDTTAQ